MHNQSKSHKRKKDHEPISINANIWTDLTLNDAIHDAFGNAQLHRIWSGLVI